MFDSPELTSHSRVNRWLVVAVVALALIVAGAVALAFFRGMTPASSAVPVASSTARPTLIADQRDSTGTPTPTPEPVATTAPAAVRPEIVGYSVTPTSVGCSAPTDGKPGLHSVPLTITWSTRGAVRVYFGVDTDDAQAGPYRTDLPAAGSITELQYDCPFTHRYTLTIVDADGTKVSRSVVVHNVGGR